MKEIGIIAGAMKPVHIGHWALIEGASRRCDNVIVFVSKGDRGGNSSEALVTGDIMRKIWVELLIPLLPANVSVEFADNPMKSIFKFFESEDEDICVYCDSQDALRFDEDRLPPHVEIVSLPRKGELNVSATMARQFIFEERRDDFMNLLPSCFPKYEIWKLLTKIQ